MKEINSQKKAGKSTVIAAQQPGGPSARIFDLLHWLFLTNVYDLTLVASFLVEKWDAAASPESVPV